MAARKRPSVLVLESRLELGGADRIMRSGLDRVGTATRAKNRKSHETCQPLDPCPTRREEQRHRRPTESRARPRGPGCRRSRSGDHWHDPWDGPERGGGAPTGDAAARSRSYSNRPPTCLHPERQSLQWLRTLPCYPYSQCFQSARLPLCPRSPQSRRPRQRLRSLPCPRSHQCYPYSPCSPYSRSRQSVRLVQTRQSHQSHQVCLVALGCNRQEPG